MIMASAPRHSDVSRVNWAPQVKPDMWGPHVSDTGANPGQPSADWGLTRGGAHCQWLWGCLTWSLVLTKSAPRQLPAFNRRQPQIAAASASGLRYRAPFYSWFAATASWQSSASNGANMRSWGGLSRRRRAPRRRPEFGRGWVQRYGAREEELVVATGSSWCAEHNGELGFEPLWL